jgi:hypothetical protein
MMKCLRSFPRGSAGGPDGITPQHLQYMLAGAADEKLKNAITDFVNLLLEGNLPLAARQVIFGGRLIALQKKDGGIRPIAIGYTLRRLAAKCANSFVIAKRSSELKPTQVGVGGIWWSRSHSSRHEKNSHKGPGRALVGQTRLLECIQLC